MLKNNYEVLIQIMHVFIIFWITFCEYNLTIYNYIIYVILN